MRMDHNRMSEVIDSLRRDHGNLERLVRLLNGRMSVLPHPGVEDVQLVVDALAYLTHFPDVSHHPLEDRIVDRLRDKRSLPSGFAEEIEAQHATIARQGNDLMRDLESVVRGEDSAWQPEALAWDLVAPNVRLYAERLRHNMAVEELILFPTALGQLNADDWQMIRDASPKDEHDPLFQAQVDERFRQLRLAIADAAHCGCE